jgi:hypothetical protein
MPGYSARSLVTILTELSLALSKIVRKLKGGGEMGSTEERILIVINVYYVNSSTGMGSSGSSSSMSFCL